jgi:hypothetical protein
MSLNQDFCHTLKVEKTPNISLLELRTEKPCNRLYIDSDKVDVFTHLSCFHVNDKSNIILIFCNNFVIIKIICKWPKFSYTLAPLSLYASFLLQIDSIVTLFPREPSILMRKWAPWGFCEEKIYNYLF